jgi:hypothetical protein
MDYRNFDPACARRHEEWVPPRPRLLRVSTILTRAIRIPTGSHQRCYHAYSPFLIVADFLSRNQAPVRNFLEFRKAGRRSAMDWGRKRWRNRRLGKVSSLFQDLTRVSHTDSSPRSRADGRASTASTFLHPFLHRLVIGRLNSITRHLRTWTNRLHHRSPKRLHYHHRHPVINLW